MAESLTTRLVRYHPETAAAILEDASVDEGSRILAGWPPDVAGRVLETMLPHEASKVLQALGGEECGQLLMDMQPRAAVRVLQQFDEEQREVFLNTLPDEQAEALRALAVWPADTAGGMMDTNVATLRDNLSIEQAIERIRRTSPQSLHYLYVADKERRLCGVLIMRDMLLAEPQTIIRDIMRTSLVTLPVDADRERIAEIFAGHGYAVLPVVDEDEHLVGVVRHDAVIEATRDEAYEDMAIMVGAGSEEHALDPVRNVVRGRLPWLLVNLATAFLAAFVVGMFEPIIASVTALAVLLPIVAGQSGNAGAQTMAVIMRGLVTNEVRPGVRRRVLMKEMAAGLINGVVIAVACGIAVWLWDGRLLLAAIIAVAMVIAMCLATVAGTLIPVMIAASGRDPAQSSSIFLTTVTDVAGFLVFLGLAALGSTWL